MCQNRNITYRKGATTHLRCGIVEYAIDRIVNENGVNRTNYNFITVGHDENLRDKIVKLLELEKVGAHVIAE